MRNWEVNKKKRKNNMWKMENMRKKLRIWKR